MLYLYNSFNDLYLDTIQITNRFLTPKFPFCPFTVPFTTPSRATTDLQSLHVSWHHLDFNINGIIPICVFFIWLLSFSSIILRFIHVVACIHSSFLFILSSIPLCGYTAGPRLMPFCSTLFLYNFDETP